MIYFVFTAFFLALNGLAIFEKNSFIRILPNICLVIGVINYALFKKNHLFIGSKTRNIDIFTYLLLLFVLLISILRTNATYATATGVTNDLATLILINIFTYLGCAYYFRDQQDISKTSSKLIGAIIFGPSVLIFFMFILFVVAYKSGTLVEGEGRGRAVLLGLVGIVAEKRNIPFIGYHPNFIGIFAGGIFVMSVLGAKFLDVSKKYRTFLYANIFICFSFMVLVDSRVTFLNAMISLLLIYFMEKIQALGKLKLFVILMPFMPFILLFMLSFLAEIDSVQSMSRNSQDLATGNYRSYLWVHCYNELFHPEPKHLIGFGEHGHLGSGVSANYAYIFVAAEEPLLTVTHNVFLQSFLDVGYIGTSLFLIVLYLVMSRSISMYKQGLSSGIVLLGFFLYFAISGTTESNFGNYNRTYFLIFMMITMATLVISSNHSYRNKTRRLKKS